MEPFETAIPAQRVTNSVYTDVTQHLALPATYAPDQDGNVMSVFAAKDMPLSHNRAALQKTVQLLSGADTSYLKFRTAPAVGVSRGGPLRNEVHRMAPSIFRGAEGGVPERAAGHQPSPAPQAPQRRGAADTEIVSPSGKKQKRKLKGSAATFQPPEMFGAAAAHRPAGDPSPATPAAEQAETAAHNEPQAPSQQFHPPAAAAAAESKKAPARPAQRERTWTTTQAEAVTDVNLAENFSNAATLVIQKARAMEEGFQYNGDGDGGEAADGEAEEADLQKRSLPLEDIKALNVEAMRVSDAGVLMEVALDDLVEVIGLMHHHIKVGCRAVLQDDDDESSKAFEHIMLSAEACLVVLNLMTADGLPMEVYNEDAIESVLEFVSHHLKYNVYVFHDAVQRQRFRQSSLSDTEQQRAAKRAKVGKKRAGVMATSAAKVVTTRVEAVMSALQHLFSRVTIQGSQMSSLVSAVLQALTVQGLEVLQLNAIALLVSVFQEYEDQRKSLVEALIGGILFNTPMGRSSRKYLVPSEDDLYILPVSALMMQLVQASCQLPAQDAEHNSKMHTYTPAVTWSDALWTAIFDRLPQAKAQRSDTEYDMRVLVEMLISDLLTVLHLPDWPAASTLLLRFVTILGSSKGIQYPDGPVRQACVDLLGLVASRLSAEVKAADDDMEWVMSIVSQSSGRPTLSMLGKPVAEPSSLEGQKQEEALASRGQWLLLDHLLRGPPSSFSAAMFNLCRMFSDEVRELVREEGEGGSGNESNVVLAEEGSALLAKYRQIAGGELTLCPCRFPEGTILGRAASIHMCRFTFKQSPLGKGGPTMLKWIIDMLDRAKQVPGTRAKAVKALGMIVEADTRLLARPEVKLGVNRSFHDESISVREAAVDLLGKHIGQDTDLALAFFDLIGQAAQDSGTSVRKRAVKILWESCIRIPNFPRATEACIRVLQRVSDPEDSIHSLVGRIFHDLWFSASGSADADGLTSSPVDRAHQLADVAASIYEGTGSGIHLPLGTTHPLVAVIIQAVKSEQGKEAAKRLERREGAAISAALLEEVIQSEDQPTPGAATDEAGPFPFLLGLHAFATADAGLLMTQRDPVRFLRDLSPYLKGTGIGAGTGDGEDQARRNAEQVICILSIITSILRNVTAVPKALVDELLKDLTSLIQHHKFVQVVAAACQCLGVLAGIDGKAAKHTVKVSLAVHAKLRQELKNVPAAGDPAAGSGALAKWASQAGRLLYMLGQLCRYAVSVLDTGKARDKSPLPMELALEVALRIFNLQGDQTAAADCFLRLKENALQAAGLVFIAKPTLMVKPEADALVASCLEMTAPAKLKMRSLGNLAELLKSEEERLLNSQKSGDNDQEQAKALAASGLKAATVHLQTQNGEGDSVSLASGLIQRYWDRVLQLANDIPRPARGVTTSSETATEEAVAVRQRALELMEAVLRGGLVAPWTAVPSMVALATDPSHLISQRARRTLRQEADKHAAFFDGRLAEGIEVAFKFHKRLSLAAGRSVDDPELVADVVKGISLLYSTIITPQRNMKINFLSTLLKRFETAVDIDAEGQPLTDLNLLKFLASVAGCLPFKRADEPLSIIHSINGVVSRRAEFVRTALKTKLKEVKGALAGTSAATSGQAGTPVAAQAYAAQPATENTAEPSTPAAATIDPDIELQATKGMAGELKAAYAVSLLLQLKRYIKTAYKLDDDRIANFSPFGEKRKNEERAGCSKAKGPGLALAGVPSAAFTSLEHAAQVYSAFKELMSDDTADYGDGVHYQLSKKARRALDSMHEDRTPGTYAPWIPSTR